MKFFSSLFLTSAFCLLALLGLPWWSVVFAGFVSALLFKQGFRASFLAAIIGGGATWLLAAFWIDSKNQGLLSAKIALLLSVGQGSTLILISGLIGALGAGIGAVVGYEMRKLRKKDASGFSNA